MRLRPAYATGSERCSFPGQEAVSNARRSTAYRTFVQSRLIGLRRALERASAEDVVLGHFRCIERESTHTFPEHRHARDDRGRAVGMQPLDLSALLVRLRREHVAQI